ncbi:MAG: pilus assembly protein TadG-related protein [Pseudomonadota bacterium]
MKRPSPANHLQRGSVAIMLALCLAVLFGFMGLAVDLSQTYDRKTELQNIADAAALAGAKELNGQLSGINNAITKAQTFAQSNSYKFGSAQVVLNEASIKFSDSPDTADASWLDASAAKASPVGLFFVKIDTRAIASPSDVGTVNTKFIKAVSAATTTTGAYGRAVAGRFAITVTPIGVCAADPDHETLNVPHAGLPDELMEYGFRRGLAYDIVNLDPLGSSPVKYQLNPLDVATSASDSSCNPANSSTSTMKPFICSGSSNIVITLPGYAFTNTGMSAALNAQFNARFTSGGVCTVPPDANVKEYPPSVAAPAAGTGWMTPTAPVLNAQTVKLLSARPFYLTATPTATKASDWGVLWSYNAAVKYAPPHDPYTTADWPLLYPVVPPTAPTTPSANGNYPAAPKNPYDQTSGTFYQAGTGARDRRVLNVVIADCRPSGLGGGGSCSTIKVLGVGKFFMTIQADVSKASDALDAEFAGLIPDNAILTKEIRLYK